MCTRLRSSAEKGIDTEGVVNPNRKAIAIISKSTKEKLDANNQQLVRKPHKRLEKSQVASTRSS